MWAQREKARYPRQAQQDGQTGRRPHVPRRNASVLRRLDGFHPPDLDQDEDEDADVAQQDEGNEGHHCHVEEGVVLQPAAGGTQMFPSSLRAVLRCNSVQKDSAAMLTYNCWFVLCPGVNSAGRVFP